MSATYYTVGMLKKFIEQNNLPDSALVLTIHPNADEWKVEGMFDGPEPFITDKLWEVRTGWNPDKLEKLCEYNNVNFPALILTPMDEETCFEWFFED